MAPSHRPRLEKRRTPATSLSFEPDVLLPSRHESPALFQGVTAPIGLFGLVAYRVSESGLRHLSGEVRFIACPIAEGAAKAVDGHALSTKPRQHLSHCDVRKRTRIARARKYKSAGAQWRKCLQNGQRPV